MTELFLIRHAQAEGNRYRMLQGRWDGDVTPLAYKEIEALGACFAERRLDAVYSSDMYRADLTAKGVIGARENLSIQYDDRLREIDVGPWTTAFYGDLLQDSREEINRFMFESDKWRIQGAETFADVAERGYAAVSDIARANEGRTVAVVSHGVTIRCILWKITGAPINDTAALPICGNAAYCRLVYENGRFSVKEINCRDHLAHLPRHSWDGTPAMRAEPFDPVSDPEYYTGCYSDAWKCAHGTLEGFDPMTYLRAAEKHYAADKRAVLRACDGDRSAGLLDLDPVRGFVQGYGWISLLYLKEEYRRRGCGIQLLGRALVYYQAKGRKALRLCVAEENKEALSFYEKWGFGVIASSRGSTGTLFEMENKIREKRILA